MHERTTEEMILGIAKCLFSSSDKNMKNAAVGKNYYLFLELKSYMLNLDKYI